MTESVTTDQTVFLRGWQTYRKVLDNNYMFHREVYDCLRQVILANAPVEYRFLDVACGDASASAKALAGTPIQHYYGIDISGPALEIAKGELAQLGCPITLQQSDFVEALASWTSPVDVVWIGQSLHHLQAPAKCELMRRIKGILGDGGLFLIWEPTLLEGEAQEGWISRFEQGSRPLWSRLEDEDWDAMLSHIRASDHAESSAMWLELGLKAGFKRAEEVYIAPTKLARIYCFR